MLLAAVLLAGMPKLARQAQLTAAWDLAGEPRPPLLMLLVSLADVASGVTLPDHGSTPPPADAAVSTKGVDAAP
jgi:hypothetical protein